MKKYSALNRCPKCGWEIASTEYIPSFSMSPSNRSFVGGALKRRCHRCGYGWDELPLDSEEEKDG